MWTLLPVFLVMYVRLEEELDKGPRHGSWYYIYQERVVMGHGTKTLVKTLKMYYKKYTAYITNIFKFVS